jgi:hypothetical protein
MNTRLGFLSFDNEHDARRAVTLLRSRGHKVHDVYSPHAVHGMDEALGLRPSRLTWVCFCCGSVGLLGMLWFQHWANAVNWPINVGGKPWNSWPAEFPVAFEMLVLLAAFGSVLACLAACRLYPGRRPADVPTCVTDDRYVVSVELTSLDGTGTLWRALTPIEAAGISEHLTRAEATR